MPDPESPRFCHPADSSRCATVLAMVDTGSNDCDLNQAVIEPSFRSSALTGYVGWYADPAPSTEAQDCRRVTVRLCGACIQYHPFGEGKCINATQTDRNAEAAPSPVLRTSSDCRLRGVMEELSWRPPPTSWLLMLSLDLCMQHRANA